MNTSISLLCTLGLMLALFTPVAEAKTRPGIIDRYAAHVSSRVKQNFRIPESWRSRAYEATARIELDPKGRVIGVSISSPSGNKAFDNAVMQAIKKTGSFGPPPFEGLRVVGLRFNSRN